MNDHLPHIYKENGQWWVYWNGNTLPCDDFADACHCAWWCS